MIEASRTMPNVDPDLLLAQVEYSVWATQKTLDMVDKLPAEAVTKPVDSSFPTIFATLQHVYHGDKYYFTFMKGDAIEFQELDSPETYVDLKNEWARLHAEMLAWAKENLRGRKDVVLRGWAVWPCWMALMQMVSHGTHHLGQVVTLVRQAGGTPTPDDFTDLIVYYLQRFPQENQMAWKEAFGMTQ